ncbi:D-2-hydroxyacid dehydrogenase [Rubrivirga sp. S365]|uniref:D-2-hydroxyacid dehydrogenase n=1 Tax=Rubrivirga litoralis TaxID=3075598 RepID=A0ABU3BMD3_9BACT|nr:MULTISPECIES: D-2-hydroxyacid dehydrogenase [unclassified Rubrivirga]MDT0630442.1 D-2-hydroxyacid dehydrogenase [Rubrivirga sp. F394]MDT7857579.1 D-2-hydroxyacid dehydrogenase [Rubrivirga sp. S365]
MADAPVLLVTVPEDRLPDDRLALVREAAAGYDVRRGAPGDSLAGVEIVLGYAEPAHVAQASDLRWIQSWSAGLDWLLEGGADVPAGLLVTSASGVHAVPIAEHVFALLLALGRRLPAHVIGQRAGRWNPDAAEGTFELEGRRVVLLGVGEIGARVARLASAFGMFVTAVQHHADGSDVPGVDRTVTNDGLLDVLPETDVLVMSLPLTDATRGMVGAGAFAALPARAVLVNVGRGETVDQGALVAALESGRLAAAGLDVFEDEPLPDDSPLWAMENVVVTPHVAGQAPHYADRALAIFLDNLGRYRRGQPLANAVDLEAGY